MQFYPITEQDLTSIKYLQPEDWSDIIPDISYYIRSDFCFPVKVMLDNEIAGIGAAIIYGTTAWLAHIIVKHEFRNRGIGSSVVDELLNITSRFRVKSCLLTATRLGKPVYQRAGFRSVGEYVFMNRVKPWHEQPVSEHVVDFRERFRTQLIELDEQVSGENRELLLTDFINEAKIYISNDTLMGYCLPRLKEGPILARTAGAGLELMKIKYQTSDKAVIPDENKEAFEFLKRNGFAEAETKGTRMVLGDDVYWQPGNIFSRAGGNFG